MKSFYKTSSHRHPVEICLAEEMFHEYAILFDIYVWLNERPIPDKLYCRQCGVRKVKISLNQYGNKNRDSGHVNWSMDVWYGICCRTIHVWMELSDPDMVNQANRENLLRLCDQEIKLLEDRTD